MKCEVKLLLIDAGGEAQLPPLGLGYIASALRRELTGRIDIKIIESNLNQEIRSYKPDIIGVSSVSKTYNNAKKIARIAKEAGLPVIIGGVHITSLPETLTGDMDIGINGEGEITIIEIMKVFLNRRKFITADLEGIKGIFYHTGKSIRETQPRELIKPLDNIDFPARDLLTTKESYHMLTSRGCPYNCTFCSTARHTRNQVRFHSARYVTEEIGKIYKAERSKYITTYDDLFCFNYKRVVEIQEELIKKNLAGKISYAVNTRTDFITEELADVLSDMGVHAVGLDIESGCARILKYLKGKDAPSIQKNIRGIEILKKHHIIPYCSFIIGSPDETKAEILETVKFIKSLKMPWFDVWILTPYPGAPTWDYALHRGLVSNNMDWSKLDFNFTGHPVILSEHLERADIIDICSELGEWKAKMMNRVKIKDATLHPFRTIKNIIYKIGAST